MTNMWFVITQLGTVVVSLKREVARISDDLVGHANLGKKNPLSQSELRPGRVLFAAAAQDKRRQ